MICREGTQGWSLAERTMAQGNYSAPLKEAINYAMSQQDFFRPTLVSLCCQALGGASKDTVPFGASFVLLGKAVGIHDDIIDNTTMRKKRPTALGMFGKEIALILSDVLAFKGFTLIRKSAEIGVPTERIMSVLDTIDQTWYEQAQSEIVELESRKKLDISPEECLQKLRMRASEVETIARVGGILADGSEDSIENIGRYGRLLGTASLLRDELIDMLEIDVLRHRIRKESLPLPLILSAKDTYARANIASVIVEKRLTSANLRDLSRISDDTGAMSRVCELISKMVEEASSCLRTLSDKTRELALLANSIRIEEKDWSLPLQPKYTNCTSA